MKYLIILFLIIVSSCTEKHPGEFDPDIAKGPFKPTMESLAQFECPEWYRDAKLGIWSSWSVAAAGEDHQWYAKYMYEEGSPTYRYHLETFGHPSEFGYKDLIPLWTAEKFTQDYANDLMDLYVRAGAKYFVSLAHHHDNFDCWDSKHHPKWNSVATGPKKDIVGIWHAAAESHPELRFGVSSHLMRAHNFYEFGRVPDKEGPCTGVPDDVMDPDYADLYFNPETMSEEEFNRNWYLRIKDVVDQYQPDILWIDNQAPSLWGRYLGKDLMAHFYNLCASRHGGLGQGVIFQKEYRNYDTRGTSVLDFEHQMLEKPFPQPWQTDTSVSGWFWNRKDEKGGFKRDDNWIIDKVIDIASKNGCLLLNIPQRGDGTIHDETRKHLEKVADWMAINGGGLYKTRPWAVCGEGPIIDWVSNGRRGKCPEEGADEIRYTRSQDNKTLYAHVLGWPGAGKSITLKSFAKGEGATAITQVELLGAEEPTAWERTDEGLKITMPAEAPAPQAICFKISVPDGFLENFSEEALLSEEEMPAYWVLPEVGATARIDWYCATLNQVEDIAWEGELMEALNLGGPDVSINGVPFKGEKDMRKARYINNNLALSMNDTVLYNQKVPALAPLLNSQAYGGTEGDNIRLELTGLTPGERYIIQFMVSDYRNDYPFLALNIDSHVARINRRETVYAHNDALVFSGIFTADTETKAIEAKAWTWKLSNTNFDPQFSAYQLRELKDNE